MTNGAKRRVAVIVAHPDDEVLGCGGTIRRHVLAGDEVAVFILADGETSRDGHAGSAAIGARHEAAQKAAAILGVSQLVARSLPDNRMDSLPLLDVVKVIEQHIRDFSPDTVYTHHIGDLNIDHRCVHKAVVTACRPQGGHPVLNLLFCEIPSSTEWQTPGSGPAFAPNCFVDIAATLDAKMQALRAYEAEMRPWPHVRSYEAVEHLARWRGATMGCAAAEAFIVGRKLWRAD
ncbi:MAG TPA: PIG-L deacetylase family protein [Pseudolabrys sp.]|nr:PIG-L deacetylase family protein [Pseudolabrys sp.]